MKTLPSKELLREVLKKEVFNVACISADEKDVCYNYTEYEDEIFGKIGEAEQINIYELAYKCKEWAVKNDKYCIKTQQTEGWFSIEILLGHSIVFCEGYTTEPEAIFKACEWIITSEMVCGVG